eukprot:GHRQ01036780.1.p1 GENE.GHRQ01036780.1~~GHRQ01036780.1.p1  ORF type:complete len:150 (-),score=41.02 GHRQ01036780.1:190-639(-)
MRQWLTCGVNGACVAPGCSVCTADCCCKVTSGAAQSGYTISMLQATHLLCVCCAYTTSHDPPLPCCLFCSILTLLQVEFGRVGFRTNRKLCKTQPEHLTGQPKIKVWTVDRELGGWAAAQRRFFDAGQVLDEIQADVGARKMEARKAKK